MTGRLNKEVPYDIGISEITVKVHRGQFMRKMAAASLADLAPMADKLNITTENPRTVKLAYRSDLPAGWFLFPPVEPRPVWSR